MLVAVVKHELCQELIANAYGYASRRKRSLLEKISPLNSRFLYAARIFVLNNEEYKMGLKELDDIKTTEGNKLWVDLAEAGFSKIKGRNLDEVLAAIGISTKEKLDKLEERYRACKSETDEDAKSILLEKKKLEESISKACQVKRTISSMNTAIIGRYRVIEAKMEVDMAIYMETTNCIIEEIEGFMPAKKRVRLTK